MRAGVLIVLFLGFVLAIAGPVAAADCEDQPDLETALRLADSVFVARVISVSDGGAAAIAAVEAVWKGPDLEETVNLDGGDINDRTSGRTRIHLVGQRYIVVAAWTRQAFNDDMCTATRLHSGSATEIPAPFQSALGTDEARMPLAPEPVATAGEGPSLRSVTLIALGLILAIVLIFLLRRAVAFRPQLNERDLVVNKTREQPDLPKPQRRYVAGWLSGKFSRSGGHQIRKMKSRRAAERSREPSKED